MQRDVLRPSDAHPQLQADQSVQPPDALLVDQPALAAEQYPDPREAETRTRVRQRPDPPGVAADRCGSSGGTTPYD
jgi:hypothetical protein